MAGYALETQAPDRLSSAVVARHVFVPYVLVDVVGELEERGLVLAADALWTEVVVGSHLRFVAFFAVLQGVFALVAFEFEQPLVVGLPQLVAHAEQSKTQVMVPGKYFNLLAALEHNVDEGVEILRLLGLLPDLCEDGVPAETLPQEHLLVFGYCAFALVADETDLVGVHEIVAVGEVDLVVLEFDPDDLLDEFVAPPLHDFEGGVELAVEDPDEDEALVGDEVEGDPADFAVGHGVVLEGELAVGEHELGVVLLCALDPPGRVDDHHVELPHFLREQLPVEVPHVAVHEAVAAALPCRLSRLVSRDQRLQVLLVVFPQVFVHEREFEAFHRV